MTEVFLVTGSSRGLGREIVEAALAAGHHVVATARKAEQLADFVDTYGDQVRAVALDVTDPLAAAAAVRTAVDAFGRLDVVVNNAGYADLAAIEDTSLEDFRAQIETNLFGVVTVTKAALPQLRAQGFGHIIQVSSVGGRMASVGLGAYQEVDLKGGTIPASDRAGHHRFFVPPLVDAGQGSGAAPGAGARAHVQSLRLASRSGQGGAEMAQ